MMKKNKQKLTLDRPATYQIKVPGVLDERWSDWYGEMEVTVISYRDGHPVTSLTCTMDQAALQGLLRRLYSLGLPLISVICIECDSEDERFIKTKESILKRLENQVRKPSSHEI